jgi:hypothetical protein
MTSSATVSANQAGAWPQLQAGPLIAGGVLIGIGAMFALAGMAVAGTHVVAATRRWSDALDIPPSQLANAGANSWRTHPNARVGLSRRDGP